MAMMPHAESAGRTQPKGLAAAQVSNTVYIEQDASFAPLGSGYLRDHMRRDAGEAGLVVRQPAPAGLLAGNESGTGEEQAAGSSSGEDGHGKKAEREDARVALGSEGGGTAVGKTDVVVGGVAWGAVFRAGWDGWVQGVWQKREAGGACGASSSSFARTRSPG